MFQPAVLRLPPNQISRPEETIRTLTLSLLGAAAVVTGILVIRHQKEAPSDARQIAWRPSAPHPTMVREVPPDLQRLERIRELGL